MSAPFDDGWAKRRIPVKKANPDDFQWATFIDDRRPQFKIHRTIGHAHSAMSWKFDTHPRGAWADMALYKKEHDEWVVQLEVHRGDPKSVLPWLAPEPAVEEQKVERRKK